MTNQKTPLKNKVTLLPKGLIEKLTDASLIISFLDENHPDGLQWFKRGAYLVDTITMYVERRVEPFLVEVLSAERKSQEAEIQQLKTQIETAKIKEDAYRDWLMVECDSDVWHLKEVNQALKKFLEIFGDTEI